VSAPENGIYISTGQVYEEVKALTQTVTRIESKVDGFITEAKDIRADVADHETRIRVLESGRWPLPAFGALTGLGGAVAGALALFAR